MKKRHQQNKKSKHTKSLQHNNRKQIHKHKKRVYDITFKIDNSTITGICPICLNPTFNDPSNLVVEGNVFHFECVVNWIKNKFEVQENNKILYIGSNTFGIFWESRKQNLELLKKINISEELKHYAKNNT